MKHLSIILAAAALTAAGVASPAAASVPSTDAAVNLSTSTHHVKIGDGRCVTLTWHSQGNPRLQAESRLVEGGTSPQWHGRKPAHGAQCVYPGSQGVGREVYRLEAHKGGQLVTVAKVTIHVDQ